MPLPPPLLSSRWMVMEVASRCVMVRSATAPVAQRPVAWLPLKIQSEQPSESSHMEITAGMVVDAAEAGGELCAGMWDADRSMTERQNTVFVRSWLLQDGNANMETIPPGNLDGFQSADGIMPHSDGMVLPYRLGVRRKEQIGFTGWLYAENFFCSYYE